MLLFLSLGQPAEKVGFYAFALVCVWWPKGQRLLMDRLGRSGYRRILALQITAVFARG